MKIGTWLMAAGVASGLVFTDGCDLGEEAEGFVADNPFAALGANTDPAPVGERGPDAEERGRADGEGVDADLGIAGRIVDSRVISDRLFVVSYEDGQCSGCKAWPNMTVTSLDVSDPVAPAVVDALSFETDPIDTNRGDDPRFAFSAFSARLLTLAVVDRTLDPETGAVDGEGGSLEIIDIGDPDALIHVTSVERPLAAVQGGVQAYGSELVSWHMEQADYDPSRVRFFLDRIDLLDPMDPQLDPPVNVPGVVAAYDPASSRAVTVDFQLQSADLAEEPCWNSPGFHDYDYDSGRCTVGHRELMLVELSEGAATVLDRRDVEGHDGVVRVAWGTQDRLHVRLSRGRDALFGAGVPARATEDLVFDDWSDGLGQPKG